MAEYLAGFDNVESLVGFQNELPPSVRLGYAQQQSECLVDVH